MVYDFGLFKGTIKDVIDSFDHSYSMWDQEKPEFQTFILENSDRVVTMPISPSAEGYAIMFAYIIDKILRNTKFNNGESRINLSSVRVSETATGYAEATMQDVYNLFDKKYSGKFDLNDIIFSPDVRREWSNPFMWDHLNKEDKFINPTIHITHG